MLQFSPSHIRGSGCVSLSTCHPKLLKALEKVPSYGKTRQALKWSSKGKLSHTRVGKFENFQKNSPSPTPWPKNPKFGTLVGVGIPPREKKLGPPSQFGGVMGVKVSTFPPSPKIGSSESPKI